MKKNNINLIAIGLILLVAVFTNPNQDRHKEVIKTELNSYIERKERINSILQVPISGEPSETDNEWDKAGQALGDMLKGAMIDRLISKTVTADNYVIFSTTVITWEGKSKVIGFGAFGNVFLSGKFDEALDEGFLTE